MTVIVTASLPAPRKLLMEGDGASPKGSRPFLDIFDLETRKRRGGMHGEIYDGGTMAAVFTTRHTRMHAHPHALTPSPSPPPHPLPPHADSACGSAPGSVTRPWVPCLTWIDPGDTTASTDCSSCSRGRRHRTHRRRERRGRGGVKRGSAERGCGKGAGEGWARQR